MSECWNKILDNNAEYALDHSLYLSGREIEVYTKELVFVNLVASRRIFVKFVHLTCNSGCQWKSEIADVVKMESTY